ncbi:hypothetical protein RA272_28310, partial [Pseudomonas syringae pv. tagetis]|uniref:hypothetical protein n=1 Tax=Pseudomonas syringae group genomosp. 7 TaxID=251699 RepID=UPI00376FC608
CWVGCGFFFCAAFVVLLLSSWGFCLWLAGGFGSLVSCCFCGWLVWGGFGLLGCGFGLVVCCLVWCVL